MINLWFDGSCGPKNPGGTAAIGVIIKDGEETVYESGEVVGKGPLMSSNVAEYAALINGLEYLIASGRCACSITVYGDSLMVIRQMKGEMRIHKNSRGLYVPFGLKCLELRPNFSDIRYVWIPREQNTLADALSNSYEESDPFFKEYLAVTKPDVQEIKFKNGSSFNLSPVSPEEELHGEI